MTNRNMLFVITNIVLVAIILFLLYILSAVWPPDSPWAPWWQMPDEVCLAIAKLAKVSKKDIVYDLGCGTGKALIVASTQFGAKGIGIEIDPLRYWIARFNVWRFSHYSSSEVKRSREVQNISSPLTPFTPTVNVKIIKDNFFNVNLSDASVIYMYLVPKAIGRLKSKFMNELKPGTRIVSYMYDLPEVYKGKVKLLTYDKKNKLFVYKLI